MIAIEVAYASVDRQLIIALEVPVGCQIAEAIRLSGILQEFPEIDMTQLSVGVFSQKRSLTDVLVAGDRIEIYRALTIDPKEARRAKAERGG